ncbi:uncharacterized protein VP01_273g7 [Puccinia sorghi]|uniref:Uncharacterized protein n=1 Tax=Puccinia sorghi TaxID=27349 RepID=A0A0L6V383_9BASI|nr:uncharacterized protein VP01_273g7 [Puccinia sorghi]
MPDGIDSWSSLSNSKPSAICIKKVTLTNWVLWKTKLTLYLWAHNCYQLLDEKWCADKKNQEKSKLKNYWALSALYQVVSKDLQDQILSNDSTFLDTWDALATLCGHMSNAKQYYYDS